MVYLRDHKPARSQFRSPRRSRPTGLTVIHTAESVLDTVGPDTGAENVAAFIRRRSTPGSYHDLVDSDSAVQLVRYTDEAYQDGTGSNPYALSISFALRTTDWRKLTPARRAAFLAQGAKAFARQQAWLKANGYPTTPLRRVTRAQSSAGVAGFISHAERDPDRRTDPGKDFPWTEWFAACKAATSGAPSKNTTPEDDMPFRDWPKADKDALAEHVWKHLIAGDHGDEYAQTLLRRSARVQGIGKALDERVVTQTRALAAALADLDVTADVDAKAVAGEIVKALPTTTAKQVADELYRRLEK